MHIRRRIHIHRVHRPNIPATLTLAPQQTQLLRAVLLMHMAMAAMEDT